MTAAAWELQQAIYQRLAGDAALLDLLGGAKIYDYVPEREAMPYVVIGDHRADEFDVTPTETSEGYGQEHRVIIHAWSEYEGKREIMLIGDAISRALRDQPLSLTGHANATIRYLNADYGADADGQAQHGVIIFRAVTEE